MIRIFSTLLLAIFLFITKSQVINADDLKRSGPPKKAEPVGFKLVGKVVKKAGVFYIRTKSEDVMFPSDNKTDYSSYQNKEVVLTGKGYVTSGVIKSKTVIGHDQVPYTHRLTSIEKIEIKVEPEKPKKEKKVEEKPKEEIPEEEKK
jgi:hypothetical protein